MQRRLILTQNWAELDIEVFINGARPKYGVA